MPPAPRKSTGNARNKKHIPYRHDDLQHGKRTGMAVDVVDKNSDDFEPFEKILSQADTRTPPRVKGTKRKSVLPSPVYEDEDGEMSMDLASPIAYFSSQRAHVPENLINAGPFSRASYLSPEVDFDEVPSPRTSVAAISASRRRSSVKLNGKSPGSGLGRSRLSQSHLSATPKTTTTRKSRAEESPRLPGDSDDDLEEGFEPPPVFEYHSHNVPPSPSPERASFEDLSREDEPQATPEPVTPVRNSRHKAKDQSSRLRERDEPLFLPGSEEEQPEASPGKQTERRKSSRVSVAQVDLAQEEVEEEAEEEPLEDVEMDYTPPVEEDFDSRRSRKLSSILEAPEPEEEDEPEPMGFGQDTRPLEDQPEEPPEDPPSISPPKKRTSKKRGSKKTSFDENSANAQRPSKKPRLNRTPLTDKTSHSRYVSIHPVTASPENPQGLRRSRRCKFSPLDWWRGEKVVYGTDFDNDRDSAMEPEDNKTVTLVPPIKAILRVPQDPVEPLGKKHKKRRGKSVTMGPESAPFPEAGWDEDTEAFGQVLDYATKEEVKRRIAFTTLMSRETPAKRADYSYQKIFSEGDNVAAGYIQLEPGAEKPNKSSKDNSYIFHVVQGAIHVKVHTTSFMICQGGCFLVPRGNYYYIKNVCERTVKVFFAQYRDPLEDEDAEERVHEREKTRRTEVSERSTPPVVQRGKTKNQRAKGKEKPPPKTGPPKGRKKK